MKSRQYWEKRLGKSWVEILKPLLKSDYIEDLVNRLNIDYALNDMYPINQDDIFRAFKLCDFDKLKIVIIGTEPGVYTGIGPLAFSDISSIYTNPSATKIRECVSDYNKDLGLDFDTTFEDWAAQGILMLNRSLTYKKDGSKSYRDDWKKFFGSVLYVIEKYKPGTVFLLWGKEAQKYSKLLSTNHHVFSWEHPMKAYLERRDWNCPNFEQVNKLYGEEQKIAW